MSSKEWTEIAGVMVTALAIEFLGKLGLEVPFFSAIGEVGRQSPALVFAFGLLIGWLLGRWRRRPSLEYVVVEDGEPLTVKRPKSLQKTVSMTFVEGKSL